MESLNFLDLFQGINTLVGGFATDPKMAFGPDLSDGAGVAAVLPGAQRASWKRC